MKKKTTVWYALEEAEKTRSIQRMRLDHACPIAELSNSSGRRSRAAHPRKW
jgi:hypothetical protein